MTIRPLIVFLSLAWAGLFGCGQGTPDASEREARSNNAEAVSPEEIAADNAAAENWLSDEVFSDPEDSSPWRANAEADLRAGHVVLRGGGMISQTLPVSALPGRRFRLRVDARSLETSQGVLRLQAVWLPVGGWNATDAAGKPLHEVQAELVRPGRTLQPHAIEISKPDKAMVSVVIYLRNVGTAPIEILQARLESLEAS